MKKGKLTKLILGLIFTVLLVQCASKDNGLSENDLTLDGTKATLTVVTGFGTNPGNLAMYKYVPSSMPSNAPIVVALHGCTQTANDYADRTAWNTLADRFKFYVVYAETNSTNNSSKCFNWFELGDITRGQGEALSIKQMVDNMKSNYSIDASKVFVTGLSAGGYMTPVMMAAYPDVFAGGAVMAGGPYKCATSMTNAFTCMSPGVDKTPAVWGDLVRAAYTGYTGSYPKLIIFQGASDYTVKPLNMTELVDQWTNVLGVDQTADFTETFRTHEHKQYKNASGTVMVETYLLTGMGHAITVDPGTDIDQGGTTGAYSEDKNVYSSYYAAKFFGLDTSIPTDTIAPTVSLTSPANGATLSGSVTISASASDNVGVTKVEIYIDGTLKSTLTASPYNYTWDTTAYSNTSHTIYAKAYDAAGLTGTSSTFTVTLNNVVIVDTIAPTVSLTSPANGATLSGSVTISASASDNVGVTKVEIYIDGTLKSTLTASPYNYTWDTTAYSNTSHTIYAKAYDAAGLTGTSSTFTVIVSNLSFGLSETFSNSGLPDNSNWTGAFSMNTLNHTSISGSNSAYGIATRSTPGETTITYSIPVTLGSAPVLSYWRQLSLSRMNYSDIVRFQVIVNNGTDNIISTQTPSTYSLSYTESAWTQKSGISLSAYAGQTITLKFVVYNKNSVYMSESAKAWIDDIVIQ